MTVQVVQMFEPTVLTTTPATLYTVPLNPITVLGRGEILFVNTDASPHVVNAYAIPAGGSFGTGNEFVPGVTIAAGGTLDVAVPNLGSNDFLQAKADAPGVVTIFALNGVIFFS